MVFRCFQILIQIVYPASHPKRMKDALRIHLEDSYRDGSFRIFYLFDIIASGVQERMSTERRSFRLLWEYDHRSVFKRYSYMFYINMSLIVPFFLILIL
ncbi:hypothetical protein [Leptospira borgpetersenii]|uniref:hypothetical protein n=1 Tax=Leptospira borgpetersenii TaxID=174 RepID=UPI00077406A4|nr:hypothetical protein [Leptospira borgpetersenii]MBE8401193.1 hypothetical protein [Leptospira borgpetersenii serovar Tarassovi]MBE8404154.1 hypothetical protein [Leptospira borgpetersenii serovar Tarassovi]MBE8407230.1 hypothetical protein [Leptospira borgpetersenii serovar Tarassovi]MBE8411590.1 hypothetical protein [Leptospira borgpetersenii serovar Tarassovi]MBE8415409.1 hypothetical protein [Leptospira borgpetersenii serovar Tarassovi]